ncbi:nickel transporter permease [Anaeromicrobium sediminis]|uniref:Nickel ABC transporter permease subunit NikC n=1 Tax=Anaeromicrobium sediminis TaxID=1478221 RepID=A0A267MMP0_9FIRM|nr:nickel transporter permease [Anaeromicrobium sediminis]PAB60135.1 nickel ABC transporter permease subunit NikC [Anaeromicrobium sediminis]
MNNKNTKKVVFIITLSIAILTILLAIIAPIFAPNDPLATDFAHILEEPNNKYPFGTDQVGRCIYSRILYGAKVSLGMTFWLLSLVFILGLVIGIISGTYGGFIDTIIMRTADTVLAFPDIVFAIAIVGILGPGMRNTILALSVIWWTKYARLTRVLVMGVKNSEYIHAAKMAGVGKLKLIIRYILPNIMSPLVVQLALDIGGMMLALAGLSFLGLGVQSPTPEWGNMLNEGRSYIQTAPWLLIYPGVAIFIVVAIFNILGDSVRDLLDPKHI